MKFKKFFQECHKRDVFKMLSIYLVSSWVLLQVLAVTWEALGIPQRTITYLIIILLAGFPLYIFLVWKFHLAPLLKKDLPAEEGEKPKARGFHKIYFSALGIISTICVVTIFLIVGNTFSKTAASLPIVNTDKIAVLKFGNNTGDPKYDIVSKMAADWVIHGITENHLGQVISQDVIAQYDDMLKGEKSARNQNIVRNYLQPAKIISGNFFLNNDKLIFQSSITDGATDKTLISFKPNSCNAENALDCIKDMAESITGFLATSANQKLMLQDSPPKYEAYQFLLEAKSTNDKNEYLSLLNKALAADPRYFEPKVLKVAYYYNQRAYKTADSLLKLIKPDSHKNTRQLNLLTMYDATLKGDNRKAYEAILKEYKIAPFDLLTNKTAMVLGLQFVNRPQDVEKIYNVIKSDSMDYQNCSNCVERVYVKALADVQLKKYGSAIDLTKKVLGEIDSELLKRPLVAALVRSERTDELSEFLFNEEIASPLEDLYKIYLLAGREFLLKDQKTTADMYLNKAKELAGQMDGEQHLAEPLFYLRDFQKAHKEYARLHNAFPQNIEYLGKLAMCNYKIGNVSDAKKNLQALDRLRSNFQFGEIDYVLAQYSALSKDEGAMYLHLLKSVAAGYLFTSKTFQNDPLFREYVNSGKFREVLNYWY